MSLFKSFRESLLETLGARAPEVSAPDDAIENAIDIAFSHDVSEEAELSEMLGSVTLSQRCDPSIWEEIFGSFCTRFSSVYADWDPDESSLFEERSEVNHTLSQSTNSSSRVLLRVEGCRAGHPQILLRFLVDAVRAWPAHISPNRSGKVEMAYLSSIVAVLRTLRIVSRAHHNRVVLKHLGLLEEIRACIDVLSIHLLNDLDDESTQTSETEYSSQLTSRDTVDMALPQRPGMSQVSASWFKSVFTEVLNAVLDFTKLSQESDEGTSANGGSPNIMRVLSLASARRLVTLACVRRRYAPLLTACLEVLFIFLEGLDSSSDPASVDVAVDMLRLLPDLESHDDASWILDPVLVLTVLGACTRSKIPGVLERMEEAGLQDRLGESFALWYSNLSITQMQEIPRVLLRTWLRISPSSLAGARSVPSDYRQRSDRDAYAFLRDANGSSGVSISSSPLSALLRVVLGAMLLAHTHLVATSTRQGCNDSLRLSILTLLEDIMEVKPSRNGIPSKLSGIQEHLLAVIRDLGLWRLLLEREFLLSSSEDVFEQSGHALSPNEDNTDPLIHPTPRPVHAEGVHSPNDWLRNLTLAQRRASLLLVSTACAAADASHEVRTILDALDDATEDTRLAVEICGVLHSLLDVGCSAPTAATLSDPDTIVTVCRLLTKVGVLDSWEDSNTMDEDDLNLEAPQSWIVARQSKLEVDISTESDASLAVGHIVLDFILMALRSSPAAQRAAILQWDVVAACFLFISSSKLRRPALRLILTLATVQPISEDDMAAKVAFVTKFVEMFPMGLSAWHDGAGPCIIFDLLTTLRYIARARKPLHQRLLAQTQCFTPLLNIIGTDITSDDERVSQVICVSVLRTLRVLCQDCRESRQVFSANIGHSVLLSAVCRHLGPSPPSPTLLCAALELVLEEDIGSMDVTPKASSVVSDALPLYFGLLRISSRDCILRGLETWSDITAQSVPSLIVCHSSGTTRGLIDWLAEASEDRELQRSLLRLIRTLAAHCLTASELRILLGLLRADERDRLNPAYDDILEALGDAFAESGPAAFFHSDPDDPRVPAAECGGVHAYFGTAPPRIPTLGLALSVWACAAPAEVSATPANRTLLAFGTAADSPGGFRGLSISLSAETLIVHAWTPTLSVQRLRVGVLMMTGWHHISITHIPGGAVAPPLLKLFVDGHLVAAARVKYPSSREPLAAFAVGSPSEITPRVPGSEQLRPWVGQIGAAHFFSDVLSPERISALYALGPAYQSAPNATESSSTLDQNPSASAALVRGVGIPEVVLVVSPEKLSENDSGRINSAFKLAPSTHVCIVSSPARMLHCLGGIATILPLFKQIPLRTKLSSAGEESVMARKHGLRAASTLKLLRNVLTGDASHIRAFLERCGGAAALAQIFGDIGASVLCDELLQEADAMATELAPCSRPLEVDVLRHLVWNLHLWKAADVTAQRRAIEMCHWAIESNFAVASAELTVPHIVDILRENFSRRDTPVASPTNGEDIGASRKGDVSSIRRAYLDLAKLIILSNPLNAGSPGKKVVEGGQQSNGNPGRDFSSPFTAALMSLLSLLWGGSGISQRTTEDTAALVCHLFALDSPVRQQMLASLESLGGPLVFLSMVRSPSVVRRVHGLRLLAYTASRPMDELIGPTLRAHLSRDLVTTPVRIALLELLCGGVPWAQIESSCSGSTPPAIVISSAARPLLTGALRDPQGGAATLDLLCMLCELHANCDALLSVDGLPSMLIKLAQFDGPGQAPEEGESIATLTATEQRVTTWHQAHVAMLSRHLLRVVLRHAMLYREAGWRYVSAVIDVLRSEAPGALFYLRTLDPGAEHANEARCIFGNAQAVLHDILVDSMEDLAVARRQDASTSGDDGGWTLISPWESVTFVRNVAMLCGMIEDVLCGVVLPEPSSGHGSAGTPDASDTSLLGLWTGSWNGPRSTSSTWLYYPAPLPNAAWKFVVKDSGGPAASAAFRELSRHPDGAEDAEFVSMRPARLALRVLLGAACHSELAHVRAGLMSEVPVLLATNLMGSEQRVIATECLTQLAIQAERSGNTQRSELAREIAALIAESRPRDASSLQAAQPFGEFERLRMLVRKRDESATSTDPPAWAEAAEHSSLLADAAAGNLIKLDKERRHAARLLLIDDRQVTSSALREAYRAVSQWPNFWATNSQDLHWKLDTAEDLSRRRFRLCRKYHFVMYGDDPQDGADPSTSDGSPVGKSPPRNDVEVDESGESYEKKLQAELPNIDASPAETPDGIVLRTSGTPRKSGSRRDSGGVVPDSPSLKGLRRTLSTVLMLTGTDTPSENNYLQEPADRMSISEAPHESPPSSIAESEATARAPSLPEDTTDAPVFGALFTTPANWIRAKGVWRGELFITLEHFHFAGYELQDGMARSAMGVISLDASRQPSMSRRWPLGDIRELHLGRYLLQPSAVEIFMEDRSSHVMFSFPSAQMRRDFLGALSKHCRGAEVYDRDRKMEAALRLQQQWLQWKISNFDYLMALNTLSGRTYNDLNQYPIFPWVLSDYSSKDLDLNDPTSFRDLSKPIGALDEARLEFFKERYQSLLHDEEVPPFFYGTHYSSAASVLFYLLRLEPFTKYSRQLQGGRFDHADRLFHSIASTWNSCLHNTSDVKELVPEFYYQPEFLRNSNLYPLGKRQDGTALGDVVLPPWACGSPDEFVRIMREALESIHVSSNLHHWIDLIFGIRQRGRAAEECYNTFFHLTYEGSVNLDSISDPMQRTAVGDQIRHFGQVPIQLFRRQHPRRTKPPPPSAAPLLNGPDAMKLMASMGPLGERTPLLTVSFIYMLPGARVLTMHRDGTMLVHRWMGVNGDGTASFTFSTSDNGIACALLPDAVAPRPLVPPSSGDGVELPTYGVFSRQYAVIQGGGALVRCDMDGSLVIHAIPEGTVIQTCRYHRSRVTCVTVTLDELWLISGSEDTTLLLWSCDPAFKMRRSSLGLGRQRMAAMPLLPQPVRGLHGHRSSVACVSASAELGVVVSSGTDGLILVHSLATGTCTRAFSLPGGVAPHLLTILPESGQILLHSHVDLALHLATLGGRHLTSLELFDRLADMQPAADGRLLLTAGSSGRVTLRWTHSLRSIMIFDAAKGPITALHVARDQSFLIGLQNGEIAVFSPDPRRRITHRFNLANARVLPTLAEASS